MNLLKLIAVGAAVGYGVNYLTKRGPDGRSKIDELKEKAPEWMEKAKPYVDQVKNQFNGRAGAANSMQTEGGNFSTGNASNLDI